MAEDLHRLWRLVQTHKYGEALDAYETEIRTGKARHIESLLEWRARLLLCLGRLDEALEGFIEANALRSKRSKGEFQPHWKAIGTIEWLLGRRTEAVQTLRRNVDLIAEGKIATSGSSRGAQDGLLLWYAAVSAADQANSKHALKFLRALDASWLKESWPGQIALWRLGDISLTELHAIAKDESKGAIDSAAAHRIDRWVKCHLLFYQGVRERESGHEMSCCEFMRRCSAGENPIVEEEWYLARHEAAICND